MILITVNATAAMTDFKAADFFSWRLSSEKGRVDIDDPDIRKEFKTKV